VDMQQWVDGKRFILDGAVVWREDAET